MKNRNRIKIRYLVVFTRYFFISCDKICAILGVLFRAIIRCYKIMSIENFTEKNRFAGRNAVIVAFGWQALTGKSSKMGIF